jgi:hypothetical protein
LTFGQGSSINSINKIPITGINQILYPPLSYYIGAVISSIFIIIFILILIINYDRRRKNLVNRNSEIIGILYNTYQDNQEECIRYLNNKRRDL